MTQFMWFCPTCGVSHGNRATRKVGTVILEKAPYLETIEFEPDKPFGVYLMGAGRGQGKTIEGYAQPEDEPEEFDRVKARFLQALREWMDKGWVSAADVEEILNREADNV